MLDLVADALGHQLARAAQAPLVGDAVAGGVHIRRHVVGVDAHDVAQGAVALQGEVFLVVVHVEDGLGRVHHTPDDRDADLDGVAEAVVDLLAGVREGHGLERDLLAGHLGGDIHALAQSRVQQGGALAAVHIAGLVQLGFGRGVDRHTEGIDKIETRILECADIFAEECEHQRLLRLEHLQATKGDPADGQPKDAGDQRGQTEHHAVVEQDTAEDHQRKPGQIQQNEQEQHRHAVFLVVQYDFLHDTNLPLI